jgi:hypothetical protein
MLVLASGENIFIPGFDSTLLIRDACARTRLLSATGRLSQMLMAFFKIHRTHQIGKTSPPKMSLRLPHPRALIVALLTLMHLTVSF